MVDFLLQIINYGDIILTRSGHCFMENLSSWSDKTLRVSKEFKKLDYIDKHNTRKRFKETTQFNPFRLNDKFPLSTLEQESPVIFH